MPTEITTEMRNTLSHHVKSSDTQLNKEVIEANEIVKRQDSSQDGQTVPLSKETSQATSQQLEQVAESMNKHVQSLKRDLYFSVDEETGETIIRVVDSESQKTIRTIPSDEFLRIQERFNQSTGMLLNASI